MMTEAARRLRGVLLMLAAVGVFAIMDALMKQLTGSYPAIQIACLRGASSLPFVAISYLVTGKLHLLRPVRFGLHILRAALAIVMMWGFLWALSRASMADTYAVFMSAPLLVVLAASWILGEKVDRQLWFAIVAGLGGVFVMLRPSVAGLVSFAGLATLLSALAYAFVVVLVRVLARTDTTASMVFWYLLMLSIGAGALAAPGWVPLHADHWPWIVAIGLTGWAGQHLITDAFRLAPASLVAPYEYTALVWAVGIDWIVWQVLPGARMIIGSTIVVGAGLYLLHRERQRT
ncbi:MAG: eamA-like transporter family protein [Steroidobacteraceae bacterium]|nr:eamA-like transporter family protein [Steroidobacteraceae bacterium]MBM2854763.1 eamA-like transporter family protein [Steroidobacteraceae bacterium]